MCVSFLGLRAVWELFLTSLPYLAKRGTKKKSGKYLTISVAGVRLERTAFGL